LVLCLELVQMNHVYSIIWEYFPHKPNVCFMSTDFWFFPLFASSFYWLCRITNLAHQHRLFCELWKNSSWESWLK
jgi:hypothetical protein